ncbi:MAG TPA: hypothetical protein VHD14_11965 [Pseudolabrys sp.]|nr:hypothetical protein [Pseudolabrys sp.]
MSWLLVAACAAGLAGCTTDGQPTASLSSSSPRGASVAFESIDGPPSGVFRKLVQKLNDEAQSRRLAVVSRESPSAYRVRGYLAAEVADGRTAIAWVWDVYDGEQHRALRISGKEQADGHQRAWAAADDAMVQKIARASMDELAAFLTSAPAAPEPPAEQGVALASTQESSPEAAGIFRIFHAKADPLPSDVGERAGPQALDPVPLPPHKPNTVASLSNGEALTLAAARH